jgi:hypothetical protein
MTFLPKRLTQLGWDLIGWTKETHFRGKIQIPSVNTFPRRESKWQKKWIWRIGTQLKNKMGEVNLNKIKLIGEACGFFQDIDVVSKLMGGLSDPQIVR